MNSLQLIERLLILLEEENKGFYQLKYHGSNYRTLEYVSDNYGDTIYFKFDKDGKLLDIMG